MKDIIGEILITQKLICFCFLLYFKNENLL